MAPASHGALATPAHAVELLRRERIALRKIPAAARAIAGALGTTGQTVALGLAGCIAALGVLGAVHATVHPLPLFDLNGELSLSRPLPDALSVPAIFSGALLFIAAGLGLAAGREAEPFPWLGLGAFFAFMGLDELAGIHEDIGKVLSIDWQIPYLPIVLLGALLWLTALDRIWEHESERLLWIGGAGAWILAQTLEAMRIVYGETHGLSGELSWPEELLEMVGSSMFLLTLYLVRRRQSGRAP